MNKLRSVTVKFDPLMFDQIRIIAQKRGETISDTVRYLIQRGLAERIMEENTDLIAGVIRNELKQALELYTVTTVKYKDNSPSTIDDSTLEQRVYLSRDGKTIIGLDKIRDITNYMTRQHWTQLRRRPGCPVN